MSEFEAGAIQAAGQALYDMRMQDGDEFATLLFGSSYTSGCETVEDAAAHSKGICASMASEAVRAYLAALSAPGKRTLAAALLRLAGEVDGEDWPTAAMKTAGWDTLDRVTGCANHNEDGCHYCETSPDARDACRNACTATFLAMLDAASPTPPEGGASDA